eukprot:scaffold14576_cov132-Isochrysis_galbana.AAC.15
MAHDNAKQRAWPRAAMHHPCELSRQDFVTPSKAHEDLGMQAQRTSERNRKSCCGSGDGKRLTFKRIP